MRICAECGSASLEERRPAVYDDCILGVRVVLIHSVTEWACKDCGAKATLIPNQPNLIAAMALTRAASQIKLNGEEIRFLRKAMGLKAAELAKLVDTAPETVSRWENGVELIGVKSERTLRVLVGLRLKDKAKAIDVDLERLLTMKISSVRDVAEEPMSFELVKVKSEKERLWDAVEPEAA